MASILIVEDHPTMRDAMRLVLEEDGHQVEEASDGEVGIAMVRDRSLPTWCCSISTSPSCRGPRCSRR